MVDDLEKLKADMDIFRQHALRYADYHPDSDASASFALAQVRGPLSPDVAARAAHLAERAVKLAEGIASLKDRAA